MTTRITVTDDGILDEFVSTDIESAHFEAMNTNQWWVGIQLNDGRHFHIQFGTNNPKAGGHCHIEEDTPENDRRTA